MTNIKRRSFLKGVLALAAAPAVAQIPSGAFVPTIYGDGIHDDWAGLQALFDGEPFKVPMFSPFTATSGLIRNGTFAISHTLQPRGTFEISDSTFFARDDEVPPPYLFDMSDDSISFARILRCQFGKDTGQVVSLPYPPVEIEMAA